MKSIKVKSITTAGEADHSIVGGQPNYHATIAVGSLGIVAMTATPVGVLVDFANAPQDLFPWGDIRNVVLAEATKPEDWQTEKVDLSMLSLELAELRGELRAALGAPAMVVTDITPEPRPHRGPPSTPKPRKAKTRRKTKASK